MGEAMSWCLPWQPGVPADGAIMPVEASMPTGMRGQREDAAETSTGLPSLPSYTSGIASRGSRWNACGPV